MARNAPDGADRRPSPKELLKLADRESRGRLKVFLGMAPGVGKTFAMLSAARAAKADGLDVVVGVVETHGRSDTAALLDGLEVLPRKPVQYRKHELMEFDLEGAIARRPKLLLVDEFAHTNAPGLVYTKRYQDVEEILRSGIDVWTTLNIQHLESLTDVVERITGVAVRETVPDKVVVKADEIVVVDLPPEELIQRLKEGKVYLPENARRAVDQFFRASNLTALRELALRHTADRVDEQMLAQLRQQGIEGPWPTAERILVCVGADDMAEAIVRTAARIASAQKADWLALHLRTSDRDMERAGQRKVDKALRLAERLGATTTRINAADLVAEVLAHAKRNNITQIVVGRARSRGIGAVYRRSLPDELIARASGMAVTVVTAAAEAERKPWLGYSGHIALTGLGAAAATVAAAVLAAHGLERITPLPNLSMIFLLAVLVSALRFGIWSGVTAAVLSFFAYNFFFIAPRYSFTIAEPQELLALMIFLVAAVATGGLAGRLREQSQALIERADATQAQYDFSRKLAGAAKLDDVLWLLAAQAAATVRGSSVILLHDGGDLVLQTAWPPVDQISTSDWAAARWARDRGEPAGRLTATLPSASFQFRPIVSTKGPIGVLGVAPDEAEDALPSTVDASLQFMVDQAALGIERTLLVEEAAKAERVREGEQLRAALLASLSHDLKTPLASIVGSVTSLRELGARMSKADRADLLANIEEEANRLARFVSNMLDMTRLEAGAIQVRRDPVDVGDVVRAAIDRARKLAPRRKVEAVLSGTLPPIRGDAALLEQVLFNLLDNADKYSGAESVTRVAAEVSGESLAITIADQGIGIPREALTKVFEKFYRVAGSDGRAAGTGLGLSICAGLVEAMGGSITADSPAELGKGTRITVTFPLDNSPPAFSGTEATA
jgi:two-component system sensor histidine kinase KdpD